MNSKRSQIGYWQTQNKELLRLYLWLVYYLPWVVRLHAQRLPHTGDVLLQGRAGGYWEVRTASGLEVTGVFHCVVTQVVLVKLQDSWNKTGTANVTGLGLGAGKGKDGTAMPMLCGLFNRQAFLQTMWRSPETHPLKSVSEVWSVPFWQLSPSGLVPEIGNSTQGFCLWWYILKPLKWWLLHRYFKTETFTNEGKFFSRRVQEHASV